MFSVNQSRHIYVAEKLGTTANHVTTLSTNGDIAVKSVGAGKDKQIYFLLKNLQTGEITKSDFISVDNITRIEPQKASNMATKMRKVEITLDSNLNGGAPIVGQDYVLGINFKNFFSSGDASQYYKDAAVHVTSSMTASAFYKAMVNALNLAFSREDGATATSNPYLSFSWKPNATTATQADAIVIEEKEQDWILGTKRQRRILFDVFPGTVYTGGGDVVWGTQTEITSSLTTVGNGKNIADLEWFCMGERGDQYRYMGYPNYIPTPYSVDASKAYDVLEIHYAFTDSGVNSYRTEKEITIAVPFVASGANDNAKHPINLIIDEIEYHTGLTIAGLSGN